MRRPIHVKRALAELRVVRADGGNPIVQEVRMVLNDLTPIGIGLFTNRSMPQDLEVVFVLLEPARFEVRGRIAWCQPANMGSHVLSQNAFDYRVGVRFCPENKAEEEKIKAFCADLAKNMLYRKAA